MAKGYLVARFEEIGGQPCPCGISKRAFIAPGNDVASMHLVDISKEAQSHYHKKTTEIYYVLGGEGWLELDTDQVAVRPGTAILISPGTRHRAVGSLKILNVAIPAFDVEDEWFD